MIKTTLIDYVKISLINIDANQLLNTEYLEFKTVVSEKTGVMSKKRIAEYHFCKVVVYDSGVILFIGSIHKLWNSINKIKSPNYERVKQYKGFNGNQFTINNIFEVNKHLQKLFNCEPQQMVFQNIELGINTTITFSPQLYLKGLLYHKNILFEYRYRGNLAQAPHRRFIFKIYNKSNQYKMPNNTLRVELKILKMIELKAIGINTFADISTNTLNNSKEMLLKRFDEVVHYDYTIRKQNLTVPEKLILNKYSNPRYWINELKPIHRDRHKKRLLKITIDNSENIHQKIRQNIIEKCVMINRLYEDPKCVIINLSSIGVDITHLLAQKSIKKTLKKKSKKSLLKRVNISV